MVVCDHCSSVVYRSEDGALLAGRESILPQSDSRLFIDATGTISGKQYLVVGHLRYGSGNGAGVWDEWYLQLQGGGELWVSEDERQLRVQEPFDTPEELIFEKLFLGAQVTIGPKTFTVRELGKASCLGGEGQLPYRVVPGESYPFAELATGDGTGFVTLEFDDDAKIQAYWGKTISQEELVIHGEPSPSTKRPERGKNVNCSNCAGALELPPRETTTLVCQYCGSALDLSDGQLRLLGKNPEGHSPSFQFEIGDKAKLRGADYEVAGRMEYVETEVGAFGTHEYPTLEYLLFSPDQGYLWLSEYDGHFVLNEQTDRTPADLSSLLHSPPKTWVTFEEETFQKYENGTVMLRYVDGAMPWKARVGDYFDYAEMVRPPFIYAVDQEGGEIDGFIGEYLNGATVRNAFAKEELSKPVGVHGAQPYVRSKITAILMWAGAAMALLNLGLVFFSTTKKGTVVYSQTITAPDYLAEVVSDPFRLPKTSIVELSLSAPVQNSWVALDLAMVDDSTDSVVAELGGELSYYSGVEGGERWSEGSQEEKHHFRSPPAGNYRFIAKGAGGSGNSVGPGRGETVQVAAANGTDAGTILCHSSWLVFSLSPLRVAAPRSF